LNAITFANGTFVLVSDEGGIFTSPGESPWRRFDTNKDLRYVLHDGTRFVAIADQTVVLSTNGIEWTRLTIPELASVKAFAFGGGIYLIARDDRLLVSSNAVDWQPRYGLGGFREIAYGNGRFVAVRSTEAFVSTNGLMWSSHPLPNNLSATTVNFGGGMFVTSASGTSTNGQDWMAHPIPGGNHAYANGAWWTFSGREWLLRSAQIEPAVRARKLGTGIELKVQAYPGKTYRLQRASTLGAWSDWRTLTPQTEASTIIDNDASQSAFYRLLSP